MKVLFISAAFPPMHAGEADQALQLCLRLAERGETVHVLTTRGCIDTGRFPFTVHSVMKDWSWTDLLRLTRFIRNCRPDAITLMYSGWIYNDHPMITFAPTIAKRLFPSVPFVTMLPIEEGSSWRTFMSRAVRKAVQVWAGWKSVEYSFGTLLRDSDSIIALSEDHLARFCELMPSVKSKAIVIPPPSLLMMYKGGKDTARKRGRSILGIEPDMFLLAFFGHVYRTKGIETLFKAVQIVSAKEKTLRLIMIGGGRQSAKASSTQRAKSIAVSEQEKSIAAYGQEMVDLAKQLGIAERVTWLQGYDWDSDEPSMYLHAADACVLPFDQGVTLSRSSLAAAATHRMPIITTKGERLAAPFLERQNVLLCPPKDSESLAVAIESVIQDLALRQRLSEGATQLANECFSWERAVDRIIETFRASPAILKCREAENSKN